MRAAQIALFSTPRIFGFWTEHAIRSKGNWCDSFPVSSEISELRAGTLHVSCEKYGSHWVLRYVGTAADCAERRDRFHDTGWDKWLKEWKRELGED